MYTSHTKNMNLPIEIRVSATRMWLGKTDKSGNNIDETTYGAKAYFMGREVASTDYGTIYKSEASAIRAVQAKIKALTANNS